MNTTSAFFQIQIKPNKKKLPAFARRDLHRLLLACCRAAVTATRACGPFNCIPVVPNRHTAGQCPCQNAKSRDTNVLDANCRWTTRATNHKRPSFSPVATRCALTASKARTQQLPSAAEGTRRSYRSRIQGKKRSRSQSDFCFLCGDRKCRKSNPAITRYPANFSLFGEKFERSICYIEFGTKEAERRPTVIASGGHVALVTHCNADQEGAEDII